MEDRELVRMAAFKLQEAGRRMASLAREADSPRLRQQLEALASELVLQEERLWAMIGNPEAGHGGGESPLRRGGPRRMAG
jgi:hypothetical protein